MSDSLNYLYTVGDVVARVVPFRPLYELCDYARCSRYHTYTTPPDPLKHDHMRMYSITKGWSQVAISTLCDEQKERIAGVYETTVVHDHLLSFTNSLKMRYVLENGTGFIEQYLLDQELEDNHFGPIGKAYAERHKLDYATLRVWNELRKKDMAEVLAQCIETKTKTIKLCKQGMFDTAKTFLKNEMEKLKV